MNSLSAGGGDGGCGEEGEGSAPAFSCCCELFCYYTPEKNVPLFGQLGSLVEERGGLYKFKRKMGA